jgi:hypothetical protein
LAKASDVEVQPQVPTTQKTLTTVQSHSASVVKLNHKFQQDFSYSSVWRHPKLCSKEFLKDYDFPGVWPSPLAEYFITTIWQIRHS